MNKIIQRYIASSFIGPFMISCVFFVSFLLSFKLFSLTNLVVNKGLSLSLTLVLLGHISITFLPMAFPISSLFASLFCMGKFSKDSEYIAMRSFGFSKSQIAMPFLFMSFFIGAMILVLNIELIPYSQVQLEHSIRSMESSQFLADIKSGSFFTSIPNVTIFSENVTNKGSNLDRIFIHVNSGDEQKIIFSHDGQMIKKRDFETSSESLRLILQDGNISKLDQTGAKLEKIIYGEYDFPVSSGSFKPLSLNKASVLPSSKLWKILNLTEEEVTAKGFDKKQIEKTRFEFWNRINTPLLCIIFTFLGVALGVQDNRGKKKNIGGISLLFLVTYYTLFFGLVTISRKGLIPTSLAVFLPTLITSAYAFKKFKQLDWIGA